MELHNSTSTQSLGVNSNAGESIVFQKGNTRLKRLVVCLVLACILLLAACVLLSVLYAELRTKTKSKSYSNHSESLPTTTAPSSDTCISAECLKIAGEFTRNINTSVDPCEDFYHYACDGWIKDNPIPPSENEQATFFKLGKATSESLRSLLEAATGLEPGSPVRKARDYYTSCMDEREVERTAKTQIKGIIQRVGSWSLGTNTTGWNASSWSWKEALLKIHKELNVDKSPLFALEVVEDPKNSKRYLIKIDMPELSLLKDQYTLNDTKVRDAHLKFMAETAVLLGSDNETAYKQMKEVLDFEAKLAQVMPRKSVVRRQYYDTYKLQEIEEKAHNFSWIQYLNDLFGGYGINITESETVIVPTPTYFANMTLLVKDESKRILSNYFIWTVVRHLLPFLSKPFRDAEMRYKRKVANTIASKPRWLECIKTTDYQRGLTFAAGYLYIEKIFDPSFIPTVKSMMDDMRLAFRKEVKSLSWIDEKTRLNVYEKEAAMIEKIGYPKLCVNYTLLDKYYTNLDVDDTHYLLNEVNVSRWYTDKALSSLRKPVNRDSWYSGPQMINAFYLREHNEINVMAGILQPPFFHGKKAPSVVNYGGIGMVLAHELTHGFDTVGRKFNKYGELNDTTGWSNSSLNEFRERANCIVEQYSKYPLEVDSGTILLDGKLTLDENIADNGGLRIAFKAYEEWVKKHGQEKLIPGLKKTNEQLFFLSYAQIWCSSFTPAARFYRSKIDSHSIPKYRVKGVLVNSEAFAKAFNCPKGSAMNPGERCRVW